MKSFLQLCAAILLFMTIATLISCEKVIVDPRDQMEEPGNGNNNGNNNGNGNGNGDYKQEADEGIFFDIETTGEKVAATFVPAMLYIRQSNETTLYATIGEPGNSRGSVQITIVGKGTNTWDWGSTVSFAYTIPKPGGGSLKYYNERYKSGSSYPYSKGNVTITSYGKEREFVTGTFYLASAGETGTLNTYAMRGKFKLRRNYDQ